MTTRVVILADCDLDHDEPEPGRAYRWTITDATDPDHPATLRIALDLCESHSKALGVPELLDVLLERGHPFGEPRRRKSPGKAAPSGDGLVCPECGTTTTAGGKPLDAAGMVRHRSRKHGVRSENPSAAASRRTREKPAS